MALVDKPSLLWVSISPKVDSLYVAGCILALATVETTKSILVSTSNSGDSRKCLESLVNNGEKEELRTPKPKVYKIPLVLCYPFSPQKPKWIPLERKRLESESLKILHSL